MYVYGIITTNYRKDESASTVRRYIQRRLNKPLLEAYYPFPLIKIHVMRRLLFSRFSLLVDDSCIIRLEEAGCTAEAQGFQRCGGGAR